MKRKIIYLLLVASIAIAGKSVAQNSEARKLVLVPMFEDDTSISYSATAPISISTPDPEHPEQKLISFTAPASQAVDNLQPSLALNYIIALQGIFPSRSLASEPYLAGIGLFGGNFAPRGWAFCSGQLLAISSNQSLFSLLGTIYGGDGRTSFALPDLRGRVAVGSSAGSTGPGLSPRPQGSRFGVQSNTVNYQ